MAKYKVTYVDDAPYVVTSGSVEELIEAPNYGLEFDWFVFYRDAMPVARIRAPHVLRIDEA